jgi:hypothetical protein
MTFSFLHPTCNQKLVYYVNGGTFKISPELISFTKSLIDLGYVEDVPFVDANNFPVLINNVQEFFDTILLKNSIKFIENNLIKCVNL